MGSQRAEQTRVFALATRLSPLKGVGFFSRGRHGGRDARVPSVARAGSASVSLAWRQKCPARQRREQARPPKTYSFKAGKITTIGKCPCAVFSTQRATTRVAPTEARRHQPCRGRSCACPIRMLQSYRKDTYQLRRQSSQLPPSVSSPRFARGTAQGFGSPPPLREGNRAGVRFPLLAGGT